MQLCILFPCSLLEYKDIQGFPGLLRDPAVRLVCVFASCLSDSFEGRETSFGFGFQKYAREKV